MSHQRAKHPHAAHPCLTTCSVLGGTALFSRPEPAQKAIDVLGEMQEARRLEVYAYVLLDDHLELLASADDLPRQIEHFKSVSAQAIITLLESLSLRGLVRGLKRFGGQSDAGSAGRLWQSGESIEPLTAPAAMRRVLEQMHQRPVQRGYVDEPTLYRYSSARNYAGQPGLLPVTTDW